MSKPLWVIRNFSAWVYEPDPALFVFWPHICFLAPQWAMLWRSFSILSFAKPQPARNAFKDLVWPHHDVGSPGHPCDEPGLRRLERSRPPASHPPILLVPLRPFFCCEPFFLVLFLLFRPDRCFFFWWAQLPPGGWGSGTIGPCRKQTATPRYLPKAGPAGNRAADGLVGGVDLGSCCRGRRSYARPPPPPPRCDWGFRGRRVGGPPFAPRTAGNVLAQCSWCCFSLKFRRQP